MRFLTLALLLFASLAANPAHAATTESGYRLAGGPITTGIPVGGGILNAGLQGEYYDNPDLEGEPRYTRKDLRVRFDWGELLPVLGTMAEDLRDFPKQGFSVRWSGQIAARFDEDYTFKVPAGGGEAKLWLNGKLVGDKPIAMKANVPVAIKLEYRCTARPASVGLFWSSPSTPEELVDSPSVATVNVNQYMNCIFADASKSTSPWNSMFGNWLKGVDGKTLTKDQVDRDVWPKCDAVIPAAMGMPGRYLMRFSGLARVEPRDWSATFLVDGKEYKGSLPAGVGYDPETNLTTAEVDTPGSKTRANTAFLNTQRDAKAPVGSGITNLIIMRPVEPGSKRYHAPGTMVNDGYKKFIGNYTVVREYASQGQGLMLKDEWKQRARITASDHLGKGYLTQGGALETYILMANETGRDLYYTLPVYPSPEFLRKTALAIKYGTDGIEPYTKPVANPVCPPLNPNLRCYLELGVEVVWNYKCGIDYMYEHVWKTNSYEWEIINHDGKLKKIFADHTGWMRLLALKTVETSNAFREVFGDEAMGDRVRTLLFGQYDSSRMWVPMVNFIDVWFNNGDGKQHVKDPHPVPYYIWGGGGALYYSSANGRGLLEPPVIADNSLNLNPLPPGTAVSNQPDSPWRFKGQAGLLSRILTHYEHSLQKREFGEIEKSTDGNKLAGYKIKVGDKPLRLYFAGCQLNSGRGGIPYVIDVKTGHRLPLLRYWGGSNKDGIQLVEGVDASFTYSVPIYSNSAGKSSPSCLLLEAGKEYWVLADTGGERLKESTPVVAGPGFEILGSAVAREAKGWGKSAVKGMELLQPGSVVAWPVDLLYLISPDIQTELGPVPAPPTASLRMDKTANYIFIKGEGEVSQTVTIPAPGTYCLSYWWATPPKGEGRPVRFYLGDQELTQGTGIKPYHHPGGFWEGSTPMFTIDQAGTHEFKIVGVGDKGVTFFSSFLLNSVDAVYGGPDCPNFPGKGEAHGEVQNKWVKRTTTQINLTRAWGIIASSYEGGWAMGGDRGRTAFMDYCNFSAPLTAVAEQKVMDVWTRLGGYEFQHYYAQFPCKGWNAYEILTMYQAADYPLVKGVIEYNKRLPKWPDGESIVAPGVTGAWLNGVVVPGTFTPKQSMAAANMSDAYAQGWVSGKLAFDDGGKRSLAQWVGGVPQWIAWNLIVKKTGDYTVSVNSSGDAGLRIFVNEVDKIAEGRSGAPLAGTVTLTPGMHTVKVRVTSGDCVIESLTVDEAK